MHGPDPLRRYVRLSKTRVESKRTLQLYLRGYFYVENLYPGMIYYVYQRWKTNPKILKKYYHTRIDIL